MKVMRITKPDKRIKEKEYIEEFHSALKTEVNMINVKTDKEYTVYAISIDEKQKYYHIIHEGDDSPSIYPIILFKITDQRVSKYWECALSFNCKRLRIFFSFNEMVNDPMFQEELIDGCKYRMEVFEKYRDLMDKEFMTEDELYHYEHDAIEIDKFGKVTSDSSFQYIKIITIDNTDGYFLSMYKGDDLENSVDDVWFDTYEELETYFDETKLVARWQE